MLLCHYILFLFYQWRGQGEVGWGGTPRTEDFIRMDETEQIILHYEQAIDMDMVKAAWGLLSSGRTTPPEAVIQIQHSQHLI